MDVELLRGRVPKTRAPGDGLNGGRASSGDASPTGTWAAGLSGPRKGVWLPVTPKLASR